MGSTGNAPHTNPLFGKNTYFTRLDVTIARRILILQLGELQATNRMGGGAEFSGWLSL